MSNLYESIPQDRREDFLHNAESAFNQATGPSVDHVIRSMGSLVINGAENELKDYAANSESVVKDAEKYAVVAEEHNAAVGNEAEAYLQAVAEHGAALVEADHIVSKSSKVHDLTPEQQAFIAAAETGIPYDPDNKPRSLEQEFTHRYLDT